MAIPENGFYGVVRGNRWPVISNRYWALFENTKSSHTNNRLLITWVITAINFTHLDTLINLPDLPVLPSHFSTEWNPNKYVEWKKQSQSDFRQNDFVAGWLKHFLLCGWKIRRHRGCGGTRRMLLRLFLRETPFSPCFHVKKNEDTVLCFHAFNPYFIPLLWVKWKMWFTKGIFLWRKNLWSPAV